MSKSWQHPEGFVFSSGAVGAIVHWRKSDGDEKYAHYARRDAWETVLPELVFSPDDGQAVSENSSVRPETTLASEKAVPIQNGSTLPSTKVDNPIWDLEALGKFAKSAYAKCRTWNELVTAFSDHGVEIVPKSGGLVLKDRSEGNQICKMSTVGLSYRAMIRHFGAGFPDHPNPSLTEMALAKKGNSPSGLKERSRKRGRGALGDEGDFDLTEE
jgi:ATP-dependent DNA helicase RecQ